MRSKSREVIFYILGFVIFAPRAFLIYFDHKLKNSLTPIDENHWMIKNRQQQILSDDYQIGKDLRQKKIFNQERYWTYEKTLPRTQFDNLSDIGIVLGRAGDSDEVELNDCVLGKTGFSDTGLTYGWFWSHLIFYKVPRSCISDTNQLKIHITKVGGPSYGVYGGPIGVGNVNQVEKLVKINDFLRYFVLLIFSVSLILFIGTYYIFVYVLVPDRKHYGIFGLMCLSIGGFLALTSTLPFRYFDLPILMVKLLFTFAAITAILFISFFISKYDFVSKKYRYFFFPITVLLVLISFAMPDLDKAYQVYELWHGIFLITFIILFVQLTTKMIRIKSDQDLWRYVFAFFVFLVCCFLDIAETALGGSNPYMITYGFMFFTTVVALSLSKEYADAFLHVEAQVGERTRDLSGALEQLKGLEKMKERFFANVSHDLKTPITIALGAIEETKNQFANTIGRVLEPADRSLRRLQEMVLGILDTVKAESGTLQLEWQAVKLTDFIHNIIDPYAVVCRKENVKLEFNGEGFGGLQVPMDPQKIERVLENLLSNAFKFTKRTTRSEKIIRVSLATDQAKVYIYIDDSGIGIPEGEHEKVFERYFQSSRTDLKEHGGSGIGLSFVKEMISLHNGSVYAAESPFHGTRFTIELPLSQNIENIQSYRIQESGTPVLRGSLDVEYPPTVPETINPARYTLLIAEDNPEVAQIVYSTLKDNYNIYFGEHGARALKILQEHDFDCVVSDIQMPEMTGDQLVEAIRKETKWKSIPIVMLSSHGDDDTIVKLLKLGANDYVAKPFRREILLSRIQAQISAHKGTTWNTKLEKLQELGQLVSGIGHQGKNRISRVGSNYPLLIKIAKDLARKLEATQPEESKRLQEKIQAVGELIGKGYNQTLDLFRAIDRYASGSDKKTVISIDEIVKDTVTLLEEKITLKNITVKTHGVSTLSFEGYNEIREAILNIISNAVDAVESGQGKIDIEGSDQGKDILLSIKDNGGGILKENLAHVFEPFFTSKKVGEGTGLGLYLARDAVELKNQGKLTITSDGPGTGASVHIRLPKVVPDVEQQRRPSMHNVGV